MNVAKMYAAIVLAFELLLSRTDGDKVCSCYGFNNQTHGMKWPEAMGNCQSDNKTLVVMETEREWEFIKNEIQNRVGSRFGEWFIGLKRNVTTGNWTWVNGKPLTIDKWQGSNPDPNDFYGMIHKELGFKGSFSTIKATVLTRGWICEKETDHCQGVCFFHTVPTSISPPGTIAVTIRGKLSTEQHTTDVSGSSTTVLTPTPAKSTDDVLMDDNSSPSPTVMIAASLGAVLFVALIILIVVIMLRRKKRQGEDAESAKQKKSGPKNEDDQLGKSQYESVNPVEAAKLLGSPNSTSDERNTRLDPPAENCEYAVVKKANKKRNEGDLVYAQLADFNKETDASKPPKPPSYKPTIYADVEELPPELPGKEDLDSSQPTYANLETTGV